LGCPLVKPAVPLGVNLAQREAPPSEFARHVIAGLSASPKWLSAKYFYDETGSRLFDEITRLPEYYPTRTELNILRAHASTIGRHAPDESALVEFGSGSTAKARLLLEHMPQVRAYVPVDISAEFMNGEATRLRGDFPALEVTAVAADFTIPFALPAATMARPRIGFFPGSTIGNLNPPDAGEFLIRARRLLGCGPLVIGVDLEKDAEMLFDAYNDAQGVTAAFNRNLLGRINRELGADFDPGAFEHLAFYNREHHRIEMHLASRRDQCVHVLGRRFEFSARETIHTENSYKYTLDGFADLAHRSGWMIGAVFTDPQQYFSVQLLVSEQPSSSTAATT
jgi:dimethylhistidine N-methyltransferase